CVDIWLSVLCVYCLILYYILYCFFFSSRRRHTRSYGDWSSDVCSSDLKLVYQFFQLILLALRAKFAHFQHGLNIILNRELTKNRSEERRVGKECRYRWLP